MRLILTTWLTVASALVLCGPYSQGGLRVVGAVGLLCAVGQVLTSTGLVRPGWTSVGRWSRKPAPLTAFESLRKQAPAVAERVSVARVLLEDPDLRQDIGADAARGAGRSIDSAIAAVQDLHQQESRRRAAVQHLGQTLRKTGSSPAADAQWRDARKSLDELARRRRAAERELADAAKSLADAWAPVVEHRRHRAEERTLTAELEKSRTDVASLTGTDIPELVGPNPAMADLIESVESLRLRLDALDELETLTEQVAPDQVPYRRRTR